MTELIKRRKIVGWSEHHRLQYYDADAKMTLATGNILGVIKALTPILIKTVVTLDDGRQQIPASSLKGAFRTVFEAMTYSCYATESSNGDFQRCGRRREDENQTESARFCPACQVFGGLGYRGRVYFHPAVTQKVVALESAEIPRETTGDQTHIGETDRRLFGAPTTRDDSIYWSKVIPAYSDLNLRIDFQNLTVEELGLLYVVLGLDTSAQVYPRLGGAKAHGYGVIEVNDVRVNIKHRESLVNPAVIYAEVDHLSHIVECIARRGDYWGFYEAGYKKVHDTMGAASLPD